MDLQPLEIKSDARGSLVEAYKLPHDGQVMYVIIKPKESRGNHYHTHKTEHFLVCYGSAEIGVKNRATGDVMTVTVSGGRPMSIKIIPDHTHVITASDEGCILLIWCDEQFNPEDPDTFPEEL